MSWNYRVLKENKFLNELYGPVDEFRVVEVYYSENGSIKAWSDCTDTILMAETHDDLKSTAQFVLEAVSKPVLVLENGELKELDKENKKE